MNDAETHFFKLASLVSQASRDPSTKTGASLISPENWFICAGFNQMPENLTHDLLSWERPYKYGLVIHAEMDLLDNARKQGARNLHGHKVYLTDAPCENCLKHLLHAGIREIYYKNADIMKRWDEPNAVRAIDRMIQATGAIVRSSEGTEYIEDLHHE